MVSGVGWDPFRPERRIYSVQLGRKEWLKRAQTQEDLERWAKEVRHKYTLENH
jgi:hypothetical protein